MPSELTTFIELLKGGGNAALIAAAWMLWRAVSSLTRIETFMSVLVEVLLRTDGIKLREGDAQMLRDMRADIRKRQGGFAMLKFLSVLAGALAIAFAAFTARADDTLTWKHPTQYTDGSALAAGDIDSTVIRWAATPDATTLDGTLSVSAPATTVTVPRDSTPGTRCYQAATLMKADVGGKQSNFAPAAWVCKTIAATGKKPKPPTALAVP